MLPRQPKQETKMKTVELKQYFNENETQVIWYITDSTNYIIDKVRGNVQFFDDKTDADSVLNNPEGYSFDKPFFNKQDSLYIFETAPFEIGVYDDNMKCLEMADDIYTLFDWIDENNCHSKFMIMDFPKDTDTDDDTDYSDYNDYDRGPSYYDPRYDGPYHYNPSGNH